MQILINTMAVASFVTIGLALWLGIDYARNT